jgi:hypothetical protein
VRGNPAPAAILSLSVAAAAWLAGPPSFDAIDGPEFAVASAEMAICHPPSYPVFLMLLRLAPGAGYPACRMLCCAVAGLVALLSFAVLRRAGIPSRAAVPGVLLLVLAPPVFAQLDCVEVHGLAIALVLAAMLCPPEGSSYALSMSVFGGHPLSLLLAPMIGVRTKGWRILLAVLPATLLLYVPLRSCAHLISHYTYPATLEHLLAYMSLYSGRLACPSTGRLAAALSGLGAPAGAALLALAVLGRPKAGELISLMLALSALACYQVPDPEGLVWIAVLPAWLPASRGLSRIIGRRLLAGAAATLLVLACSAAGLKSFLRSGDDIAGTYSSDLLRGVPAEAVYCTVGHDTFYLACLLRFEDRRPDIIPVDLYGNYFDVHLQAPLPLELAGRPVVTTRAWDDPRFHLAGLVFAPTRTGLDWGRMDIFEFDGSSPDGYAMDLVAEAWMRRALQAAPPDRERFAEEAFSWASTQAARTRVGEALGQD